MVFQGSPRARAAVAEVAKLWFRAGPKSHDFGDESTRTGSENWCGMARGWVRIYRKIRPGEYPQGPWAFDGQDAHDHPREAATRRLGGAERVGLTDRGACSSTPGPFAATRS